ncbi:MAG: VOC family protein [Comamonadaceae bacterium]
MTTTMGQAPYIDHIGIVVADLDQAIERLRPLFGTPTRIKELTEVGLRVAEFDAANVVIELLQYSEGADSFAQQVMGQRLGLNHLSARVSDVAQSITELRQAGFTPMAGFPRQGAHGRVAFFEPDAVTGLLFEVCQVDAKEHTA